MVTLRTGCALAALGIALVPGLAAAQSSNYNYNTPTSAATNWQGAYVGVHLGGGFGKAGVNRISGGLGGVQAGYNWQADRAVFGAEADLTAADVASRSIADTYRQNWRGSARGRVGYAFSNFLGFATAGLAMTGTEYKSTQGVQSSTVSGWVAGFGAEMQFTQQVTLRAEYLHYSFSDETYPGPTGPVSIGATSNVLRAALGYRF